MRVKCRVVTLRGVRRRDGEAKTPNVTNCTKPHETYKGYYEKPRHFNKTHSVVFKVNSLKHHHQYQ
ncbi:hypothetical protein E2C01_098053 [Portunus trituberculatus]|uniref:Uncharacterized protein n=1 Tax=Portunus trituberculatus TaxID=210409 RepID=A0A5B7KB62_PORTR|nr:hypothetical protein [Portunus trituberculatus]